MMWKIKSSMFWQNISNILWDWNFFSSFFISLIKSNVLDSNTRYQIALKTTCGLVICTRSVETASHCDIQPENILLDVDYCPKVAGFELLKSIERGFSLILRPMRPTKVLSYPIIDSRSGHNIQSWCLQLHDDAF